MLIFSLKGRELFEDGCKGWEWIRRFTRCRWLNFVRRTLRWYYVGSRSSICVLFLLLAELGQFIRHFPLHTSSSACITSDARLRSVSAYRHDVASLHPTIIENGYRCGPNTVVRVDLRQTSINTHALHHGSERINEKNRMVGLFFRFW